MSDPRQKRPSARPSARPKPPAPSAPKAATGASVSAPPPDAKRTSDPQGAQEAKRVSARRSSPPEGAAKKPAARAPAPKPATKGKAPTSAVGKPADPAGSQASTKADPKKRKAERDAPQTKRDAPQTKRDAPQTKRDAPQTKRDAPQAKRDAPQNGVAAPAARTADAQAGARAEQGAQLQSKPTEAPERPEAHTPDAHATRGPDEPQPLRSADSSQHARATAPTHAPRGSAANLGDDSPDGTDVFSAAEADSPEAAALAVWPERAPALEPASPTRFLLGTASEQAVPGVAEKSARSLLASDYYERQYGEHGLRSLSADVDEYGFDPHAEERARPWLELLCTRYFRLDLEGAQRIPRTGRAMLVANRSGSVPWDGLMLRTALRLQRPELSLRWLSEDAVIHYPFLGTFMNRLGAVRACPENAERMLMQDRLIAVFPEGAQGSHKLFRDRYRLQRFGRGGYIKLALKLGTPILPTAIIGAEEVNPLLGRLSLFGRKEGKDFLPITPTFPWLGPVGLLPAPVKWRVVIGDPVDLSSYGPEAAEDALLVHRLNEQVRGILQSLIDQAQGSRRSVLFG